VKLFKAFVVALTVVFLSCGTISLLSGCEKKQKSPIEKLKEGGEEAQKQAEKTAEDLNK